MFRLLALAIAALYTILLVFGDEARRPEVARSEPFGLSLVRAAYVPDTTVKSVRLPTSTISEEEAVQIALQAGAKIRSERKRAPLRGDFVVASTDDTALVEVAAAEAEPAIYWYVTGNRVNLRSGPGTSNAVVGQLTKGAETEVLADRNGWYQIRTTDGNLTAWIYGKFLQQG